MEMMNEQDREQVRPGASPAGLLRRLSPQDVLGCASVLGSVLDVIAGGKGKGSKEAAVPVQVVQLLTGQTAHLMHRDGLTFEVAVAKALRSTWTKEAVSAAKSASPKEAAERIGIAAELFAAEAQAASLSEAVKALRGVARGNLAKPLQGGGFRLGETPLPAQTHRLADAAQRLLESATSEDANEPKAVLAEFRSATNEAKVALARRKVLL